MSSLLPQSQNGIRRQISMSEASTGASTASTWTQHSTDSQGSLLSESALLSSRYARQAEHMRRYAYSPQHLQVAMRFAELAFDGSSPARRRDDDRRAHAHAPSHLFKLLLRAMKMLHLCQYDHEDICMLLAHASVYFKKVHNLCGTQMDQHEVANAAVLLLFIAHSYLLDETCPLSVWHKHLFAKYCSIQTLNAAVFRLMDIRGFRLRIDRKDVLKRHRFLMGLDTTPGTPLVMTP